MRTIAQHLEDRWYDTNLHRAWISEEQRCVAFPLYNLSGQIVGYQRYRPDSDKKRKNDPREGRYFTRIKEQKVGVWGLEAWRNSAILFITEGVFDAARFTWHRYSAIATLSNDPSPQLTNWLWVVRQQRKVVVVCDGDAAGRKLGKFGHVAIELPEGKDVGSLTKDEFGGLLNTLDGV